MVNSTIICSGATEILLPVIPKVLAAPSDYVAPLEEPVGFEASSKDNDIGGIGGGGVGGGGHNLVAVDADLGRGDIDEVDFGIVKAAEVAGVHDTTLSGHND